MKMKINEFFEKHCDEFLKHERRINPLHRRPDLCAFLILDSIALGNQDVVFYSRQDEITLAFNTNEIYAKATPDQMIDLIRCGVRYSESSDCFEMFT